MPILPGKTSFSEVGGVKEDYSDVVNANTDWSAQQVYSGFANTSASSRTASRAMVRFVAGTSPTFASSNFYESVWRENTTVLPVLAHSATGTYVITFPAQITDSVGGTQYVNLQSGQVSIDSSSTFGFVNISVTSANAVTIYTANTGGSANDLSGVTLTVWVM